MNTGEFQDVHLRGNEMRDLRVRRWAGVEGQGGAGVLHGKV